MAKKPPLTPEEVTELFAQLDDSGVLDPGGPQRKRTRRAIDPLSDEDPSGSNVDHAISRAAMAVIIGVLLLVLGMQLWYGISRRLNTANLSDTANVQNVSLALEGGVEWGNGFTQFPHDFTVEEADERTGIVEVSVVDTESSNELELFSNSQIQAAALATNALLNDNINQVVYNVSARLDEDGNITSDHLFGLLPAQGEESVIFTFVWTKYRSGDSANIDWELRIIGMDEDIAGRIQEQVNAASLTWSASFWAASSTWAVPPRSTQRTCDRRSSRAMRTNCRWDLQKTRVVSGHIGKR